MTVVQVDVFSPDDPNGTPLGTIDSAEAEAIDWRIGIRGDPGEGHVLINREHSAAALIASDRIYKIKVPVIDSGYLHAFIQKDARYTLAHPKEAGAESLDLYGPGLKALFSQARLLWQWYAPGQTARGSANYAHNLWKWVNEPYGAVAVRVIQEGINQPGTPLADMTLTFTRTLDSNGDPWANIAEEWQETVGTDVLSVLQRLEEAGDFYIEVLPDLTVNAYQSLPARDLTATVHIQKGVNLLTTLQRTLHGRAAITHLELEDSEGNYSLEVDPGWSSGERGSIGYYKAATNDDSTLNKIGQEVIRRSRSSLQPLQLEIDPLQLLPGPEGSDNGDYWINCEVLLSSGTGPQDYDEETVLVTGLRFSLDKAVDDTNESTRRKSLRIVTECNVETTSSVDPKQGFGGPIGPHSHADLLCRDAPAAREWILPIEFEITQDWTVGSGDSPQRVFAIRHRPGSNLPLMQCSWQVVAGDIELSVIGTDVDSNTTGFDNATPLTGYAGQVFHTRFRIEATEVMAKAWYDGDPMPGGWQVIASGGGFGLTGAEVLTLNRLEDAFDSQFPNPTTFRQSELQIIRGFGFPSGDTWSTAAGPGTWGISQINGAEWEIESSVNASVTGGKAVWTAASGETSVSSQLIIPNDAFGSDSCIHGGPGRSSGEEGVCGHKAPPCNHEHDYVAAGGTTGQVLAKLSDADWDTEWIDPPASGGPFEEIDSASWRLKAGVTKLFSEGEVNHIRLDDTEIELQIDNDPDIRLILTNVAHSMSIGNAAVYIANDDAELYAGVTGFYLTGSKHLIDSGNGAVIPKLAADPAGGDSEEGQQYFNTVSKKFRGYDGTNWVDLS